MIQDVKKIYLCSPDMYIRGTVNGIQTNTVDFHPRIKGYSELSFQVDRYIQIYGEQIESSCYGELKSYMYLYLEDIGYFIMEPPETSIDGNQETKSIVAYSAEKEFESRDWRGIKINCGTTDSMEYANTGEYNIDPYGFAIKYVTLWNKEDVNLSFLDQILKKVSSKWTIGHVAPSLISAKIPALEIDNENLYAVMTSEVAPRLKCLFVFDYRHFTINVYSKDEIDIDTGIFIGLRNLEQSVVVQTDSDSVFTRFTVQGEGTLEFRDVNYGDNTIINLDYFLGEPYMSPEMAEKYRQWQKFRDDNRQDYSDLAKQRTKHAEKRDELISRVPSDQTYWRNWDNMSEEGLRENLDYYKEYLEFLQISVDNRDQSEMYDADGKYQPMLLADGQTSSYYVTGLTDAEEYIVYKKVDRDVTVINTDETVNNKIIEKQYDLTEEQKETIGSLLDSYNNRKFGNIDLLNRYEIVWSDAKFSQFSEELASWQEHDPNIRMPRSGEAMTVWGRAETFTVNGTDITVAYSPIVQDPEEGGLLVPYDELQGYMELIINDSFVDGVFDPDRMIERDAIGATTQQEGWVSRVFNLVAACKEGTAVEEVVIVKDLMTYSEQDDNKLAMNAILDLVDLQLEDLNFTYSNLLKDREKLITNIKHSLGLLDYSYIVVNQDEMERCGYPTSPNSVFKYVAQEVYDENVNHDAYLELLNQENNVYKGYNTYKEIIRYIIPYIMMALRNINEHPDKKESPEVEVNENWEMYGIDELEGVKASYEEQMASLEVYSKDWDEMTPEERTIKGLNYADDKSGEKYEATTGRKKYVHYKNAIGDESTPGTIMHRLRLLYDERQEIEDAIAEIDKITNDYAVLMQYNVTEEELDNLTNLPAELVDQRRDFLFTEDELLVFDSLLKDTDYTNSNILTTSIQTVDETYETEYELLEDSEDKLSEVSQPQYKFTVNMDNFFRIEGYENWVKEFQPSTEEPSLGMLKFIMVGIRDDYAVKLRVVGYRWNPCEVTSDLTIEFSNMVTSRSGRTDLTEILDTENNRGSKNSIQIGTGSAESAQEYCTALMEVLKGNSAFLKAVQGIAQGTTGGTDVGVVQGIVGEYVNTLALSADTINVGNITGTRGEFEELFANYLDANFIATRMLEADEARIKNLQAGLVTADTVVAGLVNAQEGQFDQLTADNAFMKYLEANLVTAGEITVDELSAKLANINVLNSQYLTADSAFIKSLQSLSSTAATSVIDDAYIQNAVVNKLSVSDLKAGNIVLGSANNPNGGMKIISSNGMMTMDGTALQIHGKDSNNQDYVGIQLGYDTQQNPSLILRNENGATVLTPQGITSDAIADELIVNNMIHDGTITEDKLGFSVVKEGDSISIEQIYTGDGQFGAEWTTFKQGTSDAIAELKQDIADSLAYDLHIETPDGTNIQGGNITLRAKLLKGNVDVTTQYNDDCFVWTRTSRNTAEDTAWNSDHSTGVKNITITASDIKTSADFHCKFMYLETPSTATTPAVFAEAYASVSIVDMTDIGSLSLYLTSNLPSTIVYDPNQSGGTYSPDWETNNLTITPVVAYNGVQIPLANSNLRFAFTRQEGADRATALETGETVTNGILTVSENKISTATNGQLTYICKVEYTDPKASVPINAEASLSYSLISMVSDVKYANILGETAFLYDKDRKPVSGSSITLTADISANISISKWQYRKSDGTFADFPTTNNPSISGSTLVVKENEAGIWINNRTAVIKLVTTQSDVYDIIQINKIYDGTAGDDIVSVLLTNENHMLVVNQDGSVKTWNGASTEIFVYEGGTDQTSQWDITVTNGDGLTGTYDASTHIYTPTALTLDSSYAEFTCSRQGYSNIIKRFNISKQYSGLDGKDAVVYELRPDTYTINQDEDTTFTPASVTFNAYKKVGDGAKAAYTGRFKISESTDGKTYTVKYTTPASTEESSKTYTPSSADVVAIKCVLYASGGTLEELDQQSVIITKDGKTGADGAGGLSMGLGNYSDVLPCDVNGNVAVARDITIPFYAYKGIARVPVTAAVRSYPGNVTLKTNTAGTTTADGALVLTVPLGENFGNSATMTGDITIILTAEEKSVSYKYTWTKSKQATDGKSAILFQLYSEDGGTVEEGRSTTIKAIMYQGTQTVIPTKFVWDQFKGGKYTTISGQTSSSIVITDTMVTDQMWLRCTATYDGKDYVDYYTIDDVTDELMAYVFSTVSEFKNSKGSGAIYTRVYRNGVEVDPIKSTTFSATAPTGPKNGDYYYHLDSTTKSCVLKKYNGTQWVNAPSTDGGNYTYSYYRIDSTGKTLDTTAPWKTGRCQYIDPSIINGSMQFICEISQN